MTTSTPQSGEPTPQTQMESDKSVESSTTAGSLAEFSTVVNQIAQNCPGGVLWFRGCKKSSYKLSPTLFRHKSINDVDRLLELENRLLTRFSQRALPFLPGGLPESNWERMFLMQHYGVPTRLLDWTENSFVALWFALSGPAGANEDATIWALDPAEWNKGVFSHISFPGGILSTEDKLLDSYKPQIQDAQRSTMNNAPVALYGTHNSPRIVAQRGVFTVAGKSLDPLDSFLRVDGGDTKCLNRIDIPGEHRMRVMKDLRSAGFSESMIFPDLDGLARELSYTEGF